MKYPMKLNNFHEIPQKLPKFFASHDWRYCTLTQEDERVLLNNEKTFEID